MPCLRCRIPEHAIDGGAPARPCRFGRGTALLLPNSRGVTAARPVSISSPPKGPSSLQLSQRGGRLETRRTSSCSPWLM